MGFGNSAGPVPATTRTPELDPSSKLPFGASSGFLPDTARPGTAPNLTGTHSGAPH